LLLVLAMRIRSFPIILAGLLSGMPLLASAGIVNIEAERFEAPPMGWSGNVSLSISGETGNQQTLSASGGLRLDHMDADRQWITLANRRYGRSGREADVDESFLHLRRVQPLTEQRSWEAFVQGEQNPFRLLEWRGLVGSGMRFGPLPHAAPKTQHYLGMGGFMEWERRELPEQTHHTETLRANLYWNFRYRTETGVALSQTLYYQPAMDRLADYRALNQLSLVTPLSRGTELQIGLSLRYDSQPPAEIDRLDTSYEVALRWQFN